MTAAIMSTVFIGNPASTLSGFIAKSRYALGFKDTYLFRAKNRKGEWDDTLAQRDIFDVRKNMHA